MSTNDDPARASLLALRTRGFADFVFTTRWADDVWQWLLEYDSLM